MYFEVASVPTRISWFSMDGLSSEVSQVATCWCSCFCGVWRLIRAVWLGVRYANLLSTELPVIRHVHYEELLAFFSSESHCKLQQVFCTDGRSFYQRLFSVSFQISFCLTREWTTGQRHQRNMGKKRPRETSDRSNRFKIKCGVCEKEFDSDYRMKHNSLVHGDLLKARKHIAYHRVGAAANPFAAAAAKKRDLSLSQSIQQRHSHHQMRR